MLKYLLAALLVSFFSYAEEAREVFVNSSHCNLFCRVFGEGDPLIVLHGGPGLTQDYLLPYLKELEKSNTVIFFDQRGSGRSFCEISKESMRMEHFVADIEAIRNHFGFKTISLLAHSFGTFVAMKYAASHQEKLKNMVLVSPSPASFKEYNAFLAISFVQLLPSLEQMGKIAKSNSFAMGDPSAYAEYYRELFQYFFYEKQKARELDIGMTREACLSNLKIYEVVHKNTLLRPFDLHSELRNVKTRTLIVRGKNDLVPQASIEQLHRDLVNSRFILLNNCGHFPFIEQRAEFLKHVGGFLN